MLADLSVVGPVMHNVIFINSCFIFNSLLVYAYFFSIFVLILKLYYFLSLKQVYVYISFKKNI